MKRNFLRNTVKMLLVLFLLLSISSTGYAKTTISYYNWGLAENVWGGWIKEIMSKYEKNHPDVQIELQSAVFKDKEVAYTTRCEAGVCPDIGFFTFDSLPLFVSKGYLLDLSPLVKKEGADFIKLYNEKAVENLTIDGKLYGMPSMLMPWVLVYNAKLFEEAGLDPSRPPKTMEEFLDYAKKLTRDTNGDGKIDQWGFGMTAKRTLGLYSRFCGFLWSAGGDFLSKDNSKSVLDSAEALAGFTFFIELATKHKVAHPGAVEMGPHDVRIAAANQKVAMFIGTGFTPGMINDINPDLKALDVLNFSDFPTFGDKPAYTAATQCMAVISASTKHPEIAWDVAKYEANYENQLATWGVNGWVSARKDVGSSDKIQKDKFGKVLAVNQKFVKFPPLVVQWPEIADIVTTAIQNSLTGIQTPEKALMEAHTKVNQILKQ